VGQETIGTSKRLNRSFYNRPTLTVSRELLGKVIVYRSKVGRLSARIVEVEAYIGQDDPACHAARGMTKRNAVMFGKPGVSYIYFIYGMYSCFNIVTESAGYPAAVLIRAAEPVDGLDQMLATAPSRTPKTVLSGPGKFCRSLGLTTEHSGIDLTGKELYLEDRSLAPRRIVASERIGIKKGTELLWRFYDPESESVSRPR